MAGMNAVCKFFIRGYCRYGDRCAFFHTIPRSTSPLNSTADKIQPMPSSFVGDQGGQSVSITSPTDKSKYKWVAPHLRDKMNARSMSNEISVSDEDACNNVGSQGSPEAIVKHPEIPSRPDMDIEKNRNYAACYTPLSSLTAEDLAQFQAEHFDLDSVPVCPPPVELCLEY
ncbi:hypothetical protein AB6A40_004884 [Gnathostoma spinigerum]|uniref:Nucleoporin NUP42 n=1 Tax=Gnathostoma spinigerum TaxID=75299 RepID=A0ABD6EF01_9BILA